MRLDEYEAPVGAPTSVTDERQLKDDAAYTAATHASPEAFTGTYEAVLDEITRYGRSPLTEKLKADYEEKQAHIERQDAMNILLNSNLTLPEKQEKLAVITMPKTYDIQSVFEGSNNVGTTPVYSSESNSLAYAAVNYTDKKQDEKKAEAQNTFMGHLRNAGAQVVDLAKTMYDEGFVSSVKDTGEIGATVGTGVGTMIGAGYAGIWQVAAKDIDKANTTMTAIQQAVYKGDGKVYEAGMKVLDSLGKAIDVPFRKMGDTAFDVTKGLGGSDNAAAIAGSAFYAVPQAFGYGAGGYATIKAVTKGAGAVKAVTEGLKAGSPLPSGATTKVEPKLVPGADRMWVKPDAPLITLEKGDKDYAASVIANAAKDGKTADALGTTPAGVIMRNVLPKLSDDVNEIPLDIRNKLAEVDAKAAHFLTITKVDPWLFDPGAIKHDINLHEKIYRGQSEVYAQMPASYVNETGRAYVGRAIYGKAENEAFASAEDAISASRLINQEISAAGIRNLYGKASKAQPKQLENGEWVVEWNFQRYYDPVEFDSMLVVPSAHFLGFDVTKFANSSVGKWIFSPASRLDKGSTVGFARADIRSKNLQKVWEDVERKEILATKPIKELSEVIQKGDAEGKVYSPKDLREMYPNMGGDDFHSLLNGYLHYRRVDDQVYFTLNRAHRTQKITQGFTGLYDDRGVYIGNLGRKVTPTKPTGKEALDDNYDVVPGKKELTDGQGRPAQEVYDFTMKVAENGAKSHVGVRKVEDVNIEAVEVYRLDKPMVIDGKEHQFAIGVKEGAVPKDLLPKIPGHMPHINVEPYFVKAIPKVLYVNGNKVDRNAPGGEALYMAHATTVGVADTQKAGDSFALSMSKDAANDKYDYVAVVDRTDVDKTLVTYLDAVKLGADIGKSRKLDRLKHADGRLSKLEDPAVALRKRYQEAAKLDAFKDIDFEFRQNWLERYGKFSDHKFPETAQDISLRDLPDSVPNQTLIKQAQDMFEQYINFNKVQDSILDEPWRKGMMYMAHKLEDTIPLASEAARWAAKQKDPIFGGLLKIATVKAIHLNMQKQWFMQTSQLQELMALATLNGNFKYPVQLLNIGPRILASLFTDSKFMPNGLRNISKDNLHVGTGLTKEEFAQLVTDFKDTGIHNAIDTHAVMEGVLRDSTNKLTPTAGERAVGVVGTAIKAIPRTTKMAGFTISELTTQIGMWLYSRSEFERLNPKANMRSLHNKELIAAKAIGVGNLMQTRGDILPYQQGTLRAFLQFQAFTNKAAMQVFSSKFLTKQEKVRLAAIRAAAFGERGVLGASLITEPLRNQIYSQIEDDDQETRSLVDEIFELWERGLMDKGYNYLINSIINGEDDPNLKTDLHFQEIFATVPKSGIPLGDFYENVMTVWNGDEPMKDQLASMTAGSALLETAGMMWKLGHYADEVDTFDKSATINYIRQAAKFAPMWNNVEKALVMEHTGNLADKFGNSLDIQTTHAEAWGQVFGVPSYKATAYYDIQKQSFQIQKDVAESAKNIVKELHDIEFVFGEDDQLIPAQLEKWRRIEILIASWDAKLLGKGQQSQIMKAINQEIQKEENKGIESPLGRIFKSRANKLSVQERILGDKIQRLRETGGTGLANQMELLNMELPETPIIFGDKQ